MQYLNQNYFYLLTKLLSDSIVGNSIFGDVIISDCKLCLFVLVILQEKNTGP